MFESKKTIFNLIFFLSICTYTLAQDNKDFTLNGTTENPETKLLGISSGFISSTFSKYQITSGETKVVDGKFIIKGEIEYPHAFRFMTGTGDISGIFFLDATEQSVHFNELNIDDSPVIVDSKTDNEYQKKYLPLIKDLVAEDINLKNGWNDSLSQVKMSEIIQGRKKIREEKNIVLLKYLKKNPNSYVGMWLFAENFSIYGYNPIHEDMYNAMSDKLKNTPSGQSLYKKLEEIRTFSVNGYFPDARLLEFNGKETEVIFKELKSEYLLVDFWASWCAPCIRQFPNILEIYNSTSRDFFDIYAVSIDDTKTQKAWNKFLKKENLPWHQYLDQNGLAEKLFITSVPSNFLLDNEGKIVLRNFTVDELDEFLKLKETEN
ncbi:TlpA family protein disulfide reductase [Aequorivita capsosiphonis]|uniref:TlpA family protein disulfide reductase n=1 Tax=Aequorivita capsosiphonis TaxID=487317 RepID=UPI0003F6DC87|nr:TlpA disulfide reductase family protein [Aequorivita capsosiphonis]